MNKLLRGNGWFNIEHNETGHFMWSGHDAELILNDNKIRCIDLVFTTDEHSVLEVSISHGKFEEQYKLNKGVNSFKFYPDLSLSIPSKIIIRSDTFCPKLSVPNSDDNRELGQRLTSISIDDVPINIPDLISVVNFFEVNPNNRQLDKLKLLGISTCCLNINNNTTISDTFKNARIEASVFNTSGLRSDSRRLDSHWLIWNNLHLISDSDKYFVIEDGAEPIPDFSDHFIEFYRKLPPDWNIVYVGYDTIDSEYSEINSKICKGTPDKIHAYVIKKSLVNTLINHVNSHNTLESILETDESIKSYMFSSSLIIE